MNRKKDFKLILAHIKRNKSLAALSTFTLVISSIISGISMGMIIPILQSLSNSNDNNLFYRISKSVFGFLHINYTLLNLMITFSIILLIKTGLSSVQQYLSKHITSKIVYQIRTTAFSNILNLPINFYYNQKIGNIVASLFTSSKYSGKTIGYLLKIFVNLCFFISYMTINFIISPHLTSIIIFISMITYIFIKPRFRQGKCQGKKDKLFADTITSYIINVLGGIKTVKTFNNEKKHIDEFENISNKYRLLQMKIKKNQILTNIYFEPVISIIFIILIVFSIDVLNMPFIEILVFFFIFNRTIPLLNKINKIYLDIKIYLPHFSKIQDLIDIEEPLSSTKGGIKIKTLNKCIDFKNVYFRYPSSKNYVIKNASFSIQKNKITAITGRSGIGKTTLIDLIIRHHDPNKGQIQIDGQDLREIEKSSWNNIIGVVEQDVYLFNDTIYNNICYGKLNAEKEEVFKSAKLANIFDFINTLPKKFDTIVGERGMTLSGGQKQRISLARVLIRDPKILILDEATSALDNESEKLIQSAIKEVSKNKTIIIIAHRDSTIAIADRVFNIKDGNIIYLDKGSEGSSL